MNYRYQLAKRGKVVCPRCQHRTFVLYVDANGNTLNETVGKCDRADNCAYHYTPRQYFADNGVADEQRTEKRIPKPKIPVRPSFINANVFKASLKLYGDNLFVSYLIRSFGEDDARQLTHNYYIGTSNHWAGANVFWQIDRYGKIHTGKIMVYDPYTGKRLKRDPATGSPRNFVSWVHSVLNLKDYNLVQCLFGEHLLSDASPDTPVVIVESEKTAIICSRLVPDAVWLATGGCGLLSKRICQPLAGRDIILMPDNGKFDDWAKRGRDLVGFCRSVRICDIMEHEAMQKGDDLCDLLIERYKNKTLDQSVFDGSIFHRLRN